MKLSEAIKLGAMLRPQGFGELFTEHEGVVASCALGAAEEATNADVVVGAPKEDAEIAVVYELYASVLDRIRHCPSGKCRKFDAVEEVIAHLNDDHKWTREQIADWVATIEPQDAEPQTVEQAQPVAKQRERLLGTCS